MKNTLLAILCGGAAVIAAHAAPLTPEQALARAMGAQPARMQAISQPSLALQVADAQGQAACYVFNNANGYLVASADDCAPAVLGYADDGSAIDPAAVPPALNYWLEQYGRQIEYARLAGAQPMAARAASAQDKAPIGPLTTTKWNQSAPYNDLCPMDNGQRSVTGCVATALAQVMAYHKYPDHGISGNSYTWNGHTLSVNFAQTTYDWANMLDTYTSAATAEQQNAVATLMYSCGVAVNMNYSSSESGAASIEVPAAMVNYFGYDKGIRYYGRDYYGLDEWQDIIYDQLRDYGPVQYSGQSADGGHSFVCDGYSQDGYFHFNWGWGGVSDGYFLLTALDPESQGIGGSTSGYNYDQDVIGCVSTPVAGSAVYEQMAFDDAFTIKQATSQTGSSVTVEGPVFNLSIAPISGHMGLKYTDSQGQTVYASGTRYSALPALSGYSEYQAQVPDNLADGTYTVTPCFQDENGQWHDCLVALSAVRSATATVSGTTVTFKAIPAPALAVSALQTSLTPYYSGCDFEVKARVSNTSQAEYYGSIVVALISPYGYVEAYGDDYPIDLQPGENVDVDYISAFCNMPSTGYSAGSPSSIAPGQYQACFMDADLSTALCTPWTITLNAAPQNTQISVGQPVLAGGGSVVADKSRLQATAQVDCASGYFAGPLTLAIFPTDGDTSIAAFQSAPVFVEAGNSAQATFQGDFSVGIEGQQYMAYVYNGQNMVSSEPLIFTVGTETGIADAATDAAPGAYYTLSGIRLQGHPTAPGLYITAGGVIATK